MIMQSVFFHPRAVAHTSAAESERIVDSTAVKNADKYAVAQTLAVLAQNSAEHCKAHAAVRAAQAPQRDARDGPENEQQHAPEQDK